MKSEEIIVNDRMQQNYCYLRTEPIGQCFHPDFAPELTPEEMLQMGVFGGKYMTDCQQEFPASWFVNAKLSSGRSGVSTNPAPVPLALGLRQPKAVMTESACRALRPRKNDEVTLLEERE